SRLRVCVLPAVALLLLGPPLAGDTIVLHGGTRYTDVKTKPRGGSHIILFQSGRVLRVTNRRIQALYRRKTTWTHVRRRRGPVVSAQSKNLPRKTALRIRPMRPRPAGRAHHPVMELTP